MATIIAFDLDDTLYKERDFVESGRNTVAEAIAAATGIDAAMLRRVMAEGADAFDALLAYLGDMGFTGYTIADLLDIYRNHKPDITLDPVAEETLAELRRRGIDIALITDGRSTTQRYKFEALGLYRYFAPDRIYISGETGADKHTPLAYMNVANTAPSPRRLVYAGDNPAKDFVNANLAGWTTVMLRDSRGVNIHSQNLNDVAGIYRPRIVIDRLTEILKLIH